jgi:mannosyltransferase OCH1-like enzyme
MILKNCNIQTIISNIKSKNLSFICFGAGQQLAEACELFGDFDFFSNIFLIADNNPKPFKWKGNTKQVLSPQMAFENIGEEAIIYISSSYYPEIFEQLQNIPQLSDTECYIHNYVLHIPLDYNFDSLKSSEISLIPKKIHYCWFGGNEIPKQNQIWMESWQKYCPDYEIIRWDESNYDVSKHPYMYAAYKERKWAFVSDYARLDIIYEQGGIYLDNDVELLAGLGKLLYNEAFCGIYNLIGPALGLGFGAIPQCSIIAYLRDYYNNVNFYNYDDTLNQTDCLHHQFAALENYGYKRRNEPQVIRGLLIYPTDVLSPLDVWCNKLSFNSNTVAMHHFDASWLDNADRDLRNSRQMKYNTFFNEQQTVLVER